MGVEQWRDLLFPGYLQDAVTMLIDQPPALIINQLRHCDLARCFVALDEIDPRKARVIELRFFGGLSVEETAEVLKVSPDTVMRDWRLARAWLLAEMSRRS